MRHCLTTFLTWTNSNLDLSGEEKKRFWSDFIGQRTVEKSGMGQHRFFILPTDKATRNGMSMDA